MAFTILTTERVKRIVEALNPWFAGRQQDALIAAMDETADEARDVAYELVEPLFDFRSDIQSPAGADMVGIADSGGVFTATTVEDALSELYTLASSGGGVVDSIADGDTVNAPSRNAVFDALALKADTSALASKADIASPALTGTPTAPTALTSTNSTQLATTAFVKAQGYGVGSVTSVAAANATGITWTGSPITSSGTLTPTLSANLQAWHALATSTKQDASANLTSWSALAPSAKQDASANLTSWSAITPATKANLASPAFTGTPTHGGIEIGFRSIPNTTTSANYTMVADDAGKMRIAGTTGWTYTFNSGVFEAGDIVSCMNQSTGTLTLAGSGVGLYLAGSGGASGNRTVAARGIATVYFINSTTAIVSGNVT